MGVPDEVRDWYEEHDMTVLSGDWYERSETGESAGWQREWSRSAPWRPLEADTLWWWERKAWPWKQRSPYDRAHLEALETFFQPYIERMGSGDQAILQGLLNDRLTFEQLGSSLNITRQAAWKRMNKAVERLTELVGEDCPHNGSRLSREFAWVRALCVLDRYWEATFGLPFPGIIREEPGE